MWPLETVVLTAVILTGLGLMLTAYVLAARSGGWGQAMETDADGRWSVPRRLMVAGAVLGVVAALILTARNQTPRGVPWRVSAADLPAAAQLPAQQRVGGAHVPGHLAQRPGEAAAVEVLPAHELAGV